ncbi:transferase [uncultured Dokdonia sp.]|uniref:acyltransferase n=1 Tax=uncultured Dokdonia sp. TaxID=575653 RepID=UPI0026330AA1|nr:transferase [uncultured Dokdonia sp.]
MSVLSPLRKLRKRWKAFWYVNWIKTYYFNFKKFPFKTAMKLPVFIYGNYKLTNISGKVIIDAPIQKGMIGFGHPFEVQKRSCGLGEVVIAGTVVFKGYVHFGRDVYFHVGYDAYCEMGTFSCLGARSQLICKERIVIGNYVRIAYETQLLDSIFHQLIDMKTNTKRPITAPIELGNYNWIGNRSTIMKGTKTPDHTTLGSNSLCNKDYTDLGKYIVIGGVPAKLLQTEVKRDWEGEQPILDNLLVK